MYIWRVFINIILLMWCVHGIGSYSRTDKPCDHRSLGFQVPNDTAFLNATSCEATNEAWVFSQLSIFPATASWIFGKKAFINSSASVSSSMSFWYKTARVGVYNFILIVWRVSDSRKGTISILIFKIEFHMQQSSGHNCRPICIAFMSYDSHVSVFK